MLIARGLLTDKSTPADRLARREMQRRVARKLQPFIMIEFPSRSVAITSSNFTELQQLKETRADSNGFPCPTNSPFSTGNMTSRFLTFGSNLPANWQSESGP